MNHSCSSIFFFDTVIGEIQQYTLVDFYSLFIWKSNDIVIEKFKL